MIKKIFWIVVSALISAIVATSLTAAFNARTEKEDPAETSAIVTTTSTAAADPNIPECENPGVDENTIPPQVEPAWPETPSAE